MADDQPSRLLALSGSSWWVRPDLNCNPGGVRQRLSTLVDKGLHDLKRGRIDRAIGLLTAIHDGMRSHAEHSRNQGAAGGEA